MIILKHELKQGLPSLILWTCAISFLLAICIFLFPEMEEQMGGVSSALASMGSFSEAFGMDRLNFATFIGFYAIECGNILGLGGALYASLCAATILSKEEKDKTAEFLLTQPVSRQRVISEKLACVAILILIMNITVYIVSVFSIFLIGEKIPFKDLFQLQLAYLLLQLELATICFCVSAFLKRNSVGVALGMTILMYFLNLIANIAPAARFLKYISPFGYCEAADILTDGTLNSSMLATGTLISIVAVLIAYAVYTNKDIQ